MWDQFAYSTNSNFNRFSHNISNWMSNHALNILIILVGAWIIRILLIRIVRSLIRKTVRHDLFPTEAERKKRVQTLDSLVSAIVRVGVWVVAIIMIVSELGVNTAPLLASAGFLGIAIGIGAQGLIKDFLSGIFIITENQYRVGDIVQIGSVSGIVQAITIRTTVLRDLNGHEHHVPNGSISTTTNMTTSFSNVNENIAVAYDTNIEQLEHVINHVGEVMAAGDLKEKISIAPHFERIESFGENGIVVKILCRTVAGDQWIVKGRLYRELKKAFDQHRIEMVPTKTVKVTK